LLALGEGGTGGGDAGHKIHQVRAHGGTGFGIRRDWVRSILLEWQLLGELVRNGPVRITNPSQKNSFKS